MIRLTEQTNDPINEPVETHVEHQSSDKKWKILVGVLAALLILCGAWIIWGGVPFFPAAAPNDDGSASQGGGLMIDPNAGEFVEPERAPGVTIPGFGSMTIPANTKNLKGVNLYNPDKNAGYYYLTFTLSLLDENGEVSETLYESQLVPPGLYLQEITLSRGLASGKYKAVMFVQPYRIADLSPTNNVDLKFTLNVE